MTTESDLPAIRIYNWDSAKKLDANARKDKPSKRSANHKTTAGFATVANMMEVARAVYLASTKRQEWIASDVKLAITIFATSVGPIEPIWIASTCTRMRIVSEGTTPIRCEQITWRSANQYV